VGVENRVADRRGWTFLTNHAHVLLVVAREPGVRVSDLAETVGITERRAHTILADLDGAGYVVRTRVGRRNHYAVNPAGRFRHPVEADRCVGDLLGLFGIAPEV
jgi:DNA-binding MarR family transcriptional regulator